MEAQTLEYRILSLLRRRNSYLKYSQVIKEYLFESRETKYIYRLIVYYHRHTKAKKLAPISSLFALVNSRIKSNEADKYINVIRKVKKFPLTDTSIADEIIRRFAKRQLLKITIMDAVHSLDHDENINIDKLRSRLDEALLIDSAELLDDAYDYYSDPSQRLEEEHNEPRIATILAPELDKAIRGGLAAGELAVVIAPTGVGKTMFLINVAYHAMKQGKKVLYVTLEISTKRLASRFDQRVTRRDIEYIDSHPDIVFKKIKSLNKLGGGLKIKDSAANKMSPNELGLYLERIRKDFDFDMVIVDQVDLMFTPKEYKERRHELSSIVIALRRLGGQFKVPVWSASQATRIAGAAGSTTIWDVAEDIGKVNWADLVMTLSQTTEDKHERIMYLGTGKNRIGEGEPTITLRVDYSTMKLEGVKDG